MMTIDAKRKNENRSSMRSWRRVAVIALAIFGAAIVSFLAGYLLAIVQTTGALPGQSQPGRLETAVLHNLP